MKSINSIYLMALACVVMSCGGKKAETEEVQVTAPEEMMVGNDKDEHGCIGSAGYTWSVVKNDCIRLFEDGVFLDKSNADESVALVFSNDSVSAEIFYTDKKETEILKRSESDKTIWTKGNKTIKSDNNLWVLAVDGKVVYKQRPVVFD